MAWCLVKHRNFKEVGCEGVDWIQLTQDRVHWRDLVNAVVKILFI